MSDEPDVPPVLFIPHEPDNRRNKRMNLIAAGIAALLGLCIALSPAPPATMAANDVAGSAQAD